MYTKNQYMQDLYDWAAWYASREYIVIPCIDKKPIHPGWTEWDNPREIVGPNGAFHALWGMIGNRGIGIGCQSHGGLLVLDIDNKVKADVDYSGYLLSSEGLPERGKQLYNTLSYHLGSFEDCPISTTPSGGYHIYYRCPKEKLAGVTQQARIVIPGLGRVLADVRIPGGFCVEGPTEGYKWLSRDRRLGFYGALPMVPDELLSWLQPGEEKKVRHLDPTKAIYADDEGNVLGLQEGFVEGQYYRRMSNDDARLADAVIAARDYIYRHYQRQEGVRNESFIRVCNRLWWYFLLPDDVAQELAVEWCQAANWDEVDNIRARIKTARTSIPASYRIGGGLRYI